MHQKLSFWSLKFFPTKKWGFTPFKYPSYKHHQVLQHHQQHQRPAPSASPVPTGEAQAYILIFIPDYGSFRLEQQLLGQKLGVFVCSELLLSLGFQQNIVPLLNYGWLLLYYGWLFSYGWLELWLTFQLWVMGRLFWSVQKTSNIGDILTQAVYT